LNKERGGDMKRSQVVEPTFESNKNNLARDLTFSREMPWSSKPKPRKVTVDDFTKLK
jgi:hypothetical protein